MAEEPPFSLIDTAKVALSNVPPGLWTMLRGDPNAETTLGRYIPGGVQGLYGSIGDAGATIYNLLGNQLPRAAGYEPLVNPIEPADTFQTALQHHANAAAQADIEVPTAIEPRNAYERVAGGVARSLAETGYIPGLGRALTYAPRAVQLAADVVAPSSMMPKKMAAITTGLAVAHEADRPTEEHRYDLAEPEAVSAPTTSGEQFKSRYDITEPTTDTTAPTTTPVSRYDIASDLPQADISVKPRGAEPITWSQIGLGALGALAALELRRPATSVWGAVTSTKRNAEWAAQREAVGLATADPNVPKPPGYDPALAEQPPVVSLPGDTGVGTAINTKFVNADARVQQTLGAYEEAAGGDALAVKRMWGQFNDRLTAQNRSQEFAETGIEPITKVQLPSINRYARRYAALDDQTRDAVKSAIVQRDELNNRDIMMRDAVAKSNVPPGGIDDPSLRMSLWEVPTTQMRTNVAQRMADPTVASFVNEYDSMKRAYLQHMVDRGVISQATMDNLQTWHPNHLSRVDPTGRLVDLLGPRELTERGGPNVITQDPIQTMADQLTQLIRHAEINDRNTMLVETFQRGQAANPKLPIVITEIPERAAGGGPIKDDQRRLLHVGYGDIQKSFEVHDPYTYDIVTKGNDFLPLGLQAVAHGTQMMQSFTTGTGALLFGRLFGLATNLPRNVLAGATQRPRGFAGSIEDKIIQRATGGLAGLRVPAPSIIPGVAYELGAGSLAMLGKGVANMLERGTSAPARMVRAMLGEPGMRQLTDSLNTAYARSNLSQARGEGAAGAGSGSRSRVEALTNVVPQRGRLSRYAAEVEKRPFNPTMTNVPELYLGNGTAFVVRSRNLLNNLNNLMNDAYHLHVRRINKDVPTLERAYEVNQLVGAPGRAGESRAVRALTSSIPYLGPSIQGTVRAAQAWRDAPLGTALGKVVTYGMITAAQEWFALQGGPNHLNFLHNLLTPRQQTDNAYMLTDPNDPLNHSRMSLPQEDRAIWSVVSSAMRHGLQTTLAAGDEPLRQRLVNFFGHWFNEYITPREREGLQYSATQLADPLIQLPAPINALVNALGVRYRGDISNVIDAARAGRPMLGAKSPLVSGIQEPYALPGQDVSHEGGDVGIMGAMAASLLGATWQTLSLLSNEAQHASSWSEFVHGAGDVLQSQFRKSNAVGGGVLWPQAATISPRGAPEQQYVTNTRIALASLPTLQQGADVGLTRHGGAGIAVRGDTSVPTDPQMLVLLQQAHQLSNYLKTKLEPQITDIDKLRQGIPELPASQDQKRELMNTYALQLQMLYRQGQQIIDRANEQASAQFHTSIDFAKPINWAGTIDQFAPPSRMLLVH